MMNGVPGARVEYVGGDKIIMTNPCTPLPNVLGTDTALAFN